MSETILPHFDAPPLPLPDLGRAPGAVAPPSARAAGLLSAGYGFLLAVATLWIDGSAFMRLSGVGSPDILRQASVGLAAGNLLLAAFLILGGVLLLCGKLRGRTLLLVFAWIVLPIMLAGMIVTVVAVREGPSQRNLAISLFRFHSAVAACSILSGLVLGWLLLGGASARWKDATLWRPAPPPLPWSRPRMSVQALFSLILAFLPPFGLMQILSLALGVRGLRVVRRSGGQRWGRGMAAAGAIISVTLLVSMAAAVGYAAHSVIIESSGRSDRDAVVHRLMELDAAERLCAQLQPDHFDASSSTLTDLLRVTAPYAPLDPAAAAALRSADAAARESDPRPYLGYLFKVSHFSDASADETSPNYLIFAYPADGVSPTFTLDPQGRIQRISHLSLPPSGRISHAQADAWDAEKVIDVR